ncbi:DUF1553 domain-containing protein [Lunatimonas salinarum]|uniref:DUF1553 domain-containing protein n=1 Tax=Lunatimonas salinarum TaxID=1774590 RepID=UPI001FD761D4|nr:DUF1553 domain-containing protein [Lunatimonas salinarum]
MNKAALSLYYTKSPFLAFLVIGYMLVSCGVEKPAEIVEAELSLPEQIDYNLHVKPILSDRCFSCHGPDPNTREAGLRLDIAEGVYGPLADNKHKVAVFPGDLHRSDVYDRLVSEDPERVMPPPQSNLSLSPREKAIIIRWIEQGAVYKPHWAYIRPEKSPLPKVSDPSWPVNEIDYFVMGKLDQNNLKPSSPVAKEKLIRRVSLDLTGLPPDLEQIDEFLNDPSPNAYEKVVDKLLSTVAYAERMALDWLDVARFADSNGLHADGYRMMWPWRDWVIEAFDENMPYDRFIEWQVAGDMLPNPSKKQILATAFNRNNQTNSEAGIVDEEYRLEYVFDRSETIGKAFLGLTLDCARCHDHKFDPISQKDYFSMAAFFNNMDELGMTSNDGNSGPFLLYLDDEEERELEALKARIRALETEKANEQQKFLQEQGETALPVSWLPEKTLKMGLISHFRLDEYAEGKSQAEAGKFSARVLGSPDVIPSPTGKGLRFKDEKDLMEFPDLGLVEMTDVFSFSFWAKPESNEPYRSLVGNSGEKNNFYRGYEIFLDSTNRIQVRIINALPDNAIHLITKDPIKMGEWSHISLTYDGSANASGTHLYINGKPATSVTLVDNLYKSILPVKDSSGKPVNRPLRLAKSYRLYDGDNGVYTGGLDDLYLFNRVLTGLEIAELYYAGNSSEAKKFDATEIGRHLEYHLNRKRQQKEEALNELRKEKLAMLQEKKEVMVMKERANIRKTYILDRGDYNFPTDEVQADVPAFLPSLDGQWPKNRLGLAKWLTHPDHPLVSRVTVNRYWNQFFGRGLVQSVGDFGSQGELPTHPLLLDWLAVDFVESGWDVKALVKKIVTSATYKQESLATPELAELDPDNALLARGPRHRLLGEFIRDSYLHASGLLVEEIGGPSVKPYQPEGLWEEKGEFSNFLRTYITDQGKDLYRRSMYTFIRRTSPAPAMTNFDVPGREDCIVQRSETNTPLQPLVLMNDPQIIEASRALAEKMQKEGGRKLEDQLTYGFRRVTGRMPAEREMQLFKEMFSEELHRFRQNKRDRDALLQVGASKVDVGMPLETTAALTTVANLMFNHFDFYTKQ